MKVAIKDGACVGAGQCALVAGEVFDQDDDGIVLVLNQPHAADLPAVRRAVSLCPARAISLVE